MFIVTIIFVVLTCPLDYCSVRIFSCALVYKEIYYERYIAVSILAISNFIKISSLVSFISNQSPTGNLTIFSIIAAVDILIYALSFCCYKRKQGELLRDAIESSVSSLKDNYSLPNELDPLFTEFLYGYIKKNKNFKEMIEMKRRSGLGPEKKE